MSTLRMLSDECKKCPNVKECNNKRMVACRLKEMPKEAVNNLTKSLTSPLSSPMPKSYTPITIKMGEYSNIDTSMKEIPERIAKNFNKKIFNLNCAFNKS